VTLEVRPCRPEEQLAGLTPIFHYFGATPKEEHVQRFSRIQPPERLHAAFEDGRAVGVEAESGGQVFQVRADRVVLSSGAIRSPHLLLLSGIGPEDQLQEFGIPTV